MLNGFRPCKRCHPLEVKGEFPTWLRGIIEEIENNPVHKWKDQDLRERNIEPNRIRRWFKQNLGMTFHTYLRTLRISQAFGRIKHGDKIIEAAYDSGYESLSGFTDSFKKNTGFFSDNKVYTVSLFGNEHKEFCKLVGLPYKNKETRKRHESTIKTEKFVFVPIRKIEECKEQELMDIQVDNQKSFVANGLLVHNSSIESMMCGTPVISNRTGGLQDQNIDKDTGEQYGVSIPPAVKSLTGSQEIPYIFDCRNSDKQVLAAFLKMYAMTWDERKELGKRARKYALENFNLEQMIDSWDKVITRKVEEYRKFGNRDRIKFIKV